MAADQTLKPPLIAKLSFSLGYPVESIVLRAFELFILFYYTQVLGLSGALTGLALAIAMLFDAICDPLIGVWSDNLRNARFGRRHSFMFLSAIPLGFAFALVYMPPESLTGFSLFLWLTVTAVITRLSCGLFLVPYSAQFAEMSRDPEIRASLTIYKAVMMAVVDMAVVSLAFGYFFNTGGTDRSGQLDPTNYPPFALSFGVLLVLVTLASALGTYRFMRRIEAGQVLPPAEHMGVLHLARKWKHVLMGAPNVRAIILAAMISTLTSGTVRALTSHMGIYFWKLTPAEIGYWQQAHVPGMFIGLFICRYLLRRFEMIHMVVVAMICQFSMIGILPLLRIVGLLPPEADPMVPWLLAGTNLLAGLGGGFMLVLSGLVCAEAADEAEYRTGLPEQGLILGFIFLAIKTGSAASKLVSGAALDLMQFPIGAKSISPEMQTNLGLLVIGTLVVLGSSAVFLYSRFSLRRADHAMMIAAIRERHDRARSEAVVETDVEGAPVAPGLKPA